MLVLFLYQRRFGVFVRIVLVGLKDLMDIALGKRCSLEQRKLIQSTWNIEAKKLVS